MSQDQCTSYPYSSLLLVEQSSSNLYHSVQFFLQSLMQSVWHCLFFGGFRYERQSRDLSFCLSLLSYNERSIRKLQENFSCFGDKLSEEFVFSCFVTIVAGARKFAKPEAKVNVSINSYIVFISHQLPLLLYRNLSQFLQNSNLS